MKDDLNTEDKICSILTQEVLTVESNENIRSVLEKMLKWNVSSLVVTENHRAVGIITGGEIFAEYLPRLLIWASSIPTRRQL